MPTVRIVADYCSPGYQIIDADARPDATLPVSEALRLRLAAWNDHYEDHCHPRHYEDVSGIAFDFVAFAGDGLTLARAVKRELPHWTVLYWDEALDWYLSRDPRAYDPRKAEYEVSLEDARADAAARPPFCR